MVGVGNNCSACSGCCDLGELRSRVLRISRYVTMRHVSRRRRAKEPQVIKRMVILCCNWLMSIGSCCCCPRATGIYGAAVAMVTAVLGCLK